MAQRGALEDVIDVNLPCRWRRVSRRRRSLSPALPISRGRTGLPALKPNEFFLFSNDRRSRAFVDEWTSSRQTSSITWSFPQCRRCATGRSGSSFACRHRRLLADSVEKSTMVCAAEKYASEIEIFTFGRGFRARISRSSVQKKRLHQSKIREFGQADCFQQNRPEAATPV